MSKLNSDDLSDNTDERDVQTAINKTKDSLEKFKSVMTAVDLLDQVFSLPLPDFMMSFGTVLAAQTQAIKDVLGGDQIPLLQKEFETRLGGQVLTALENVRKGYEECKRFQWTPISDDMATAIGGWDSFIQTEGSKYIVGANDPRLNQPVPVFGTALGVAPANKRDYRTAPEITSRLLQLTAQLKAANNNGMLAPIDAIVTGIMNRLDAVSVPDSTEQQLASWAATTVGPILNDIRAKIIVPMQPLTMFAKDPNFDNYIKTFGVVGGSATSASPILGAPPYKDMLPMLSTAAIRALGDRSATLWINSFSSEVSLYMFSAAKSVHAALDDPKIQNTQVVIELQQDMRELDNVVTNLNPQKPGGPNYAATRTSQTRFEWAELRTKIDVIISTFARINKDNIGAISGSGGALGNFFFRMPSTARMQYYTYIVQAFLEDMTSGDKPWTFEMDYIVRHLEEKMKEIDKGMQRLDAAETALEEPTQREVAEQEAGKSRARAIASTLTDARTCISKYMRLHHDFACKRNRQGMRYMLYWRTLTLSGNPIPAAINAVNVYYTDLNKVMTAGIATVEALAKTAQDPIAKHHDAIHAMSRADVQVIEDAKQSLARVVKKANDRLKYMYNRPMTVRESITDPQILLLYALKAARFGLVLLSLWLATRIFMPMYKKNVYDQNRAPPHPALLVLIFAGIDAALTAAVVIFLYLLKYMFFVPGNGFPVDDYLISRFALDAVVTSTLVLVLALLMAVVVRSRKYFRYRFEGERGIRALNLLVRYVAAAVLLLPFYRLAD